MMIRDLHMKLSIFLNSVMPFDIFFFTRELLKNILTSLDVSFMHVKKSINAIHSSASFFHSFFIDLNGNDNRKLRDKEAAAKLHEIIF